jgi:hypothetical protein
MTKKALVSWLMQLRHTAVVKLLTKDLKDHQDPNMLWPKKIGMEIDPV